jgi:hypothetical protein
MFQVPGVVKFNANWGLRTEDCELETEDYTMLSAQYPMLSRCSVLQDAIGR